MNDFLLRLYVVLCISFFTHQARAGVLLEPFVGYGQTTVSTTDLSATDAQSKDSGLGYGSRLGYRFNQSFWIAAEYAAGNGTSKSSTPGIADMNYNNTAMSAVVGYDHNHFRVWAGYGFSDKVTLKDSSGTETNFSGTNYKLGVGLRPSTSFSVNFEYLIPKYTKYNTAGGADADVSTIYSKMDVSSMFLSVSFPFDLGK